MIGGAGKAVVRAFFIHQIMSLVDGLYQQARAKFSSRVEFWNAMNGRKEASVSAQDWVPRAVASVARNPEAAGAAALGALMAGKSVYDTGAAGPDGVSREEASLQAAMAQRAKMRELTGGEPSVRDRLHQKQLELAKYDKEHRGIAALRQGALSAAAGAGGPTRTAA